MYILKEKTIDDSLDENEKILMISKEKAKIQEIKSSLESLSIKNSKWYIESLNVDLNKIEENKLYFIKKIEFVEFVGDFEKVVSFFENEKEAINERDRLEEVEDDIDVSYEVEMVIIDKIFDPEWDLSQYFFLLISKGEFEKSLSIQYVLDNIDVLLKENDEYIEKAIFNLKVSNEKDIKNRIYNRLKKGYMDLLLESYRLKFFIERFDKVGCNGKNIFLKKFNENEKIINKEKYKNKIIKEIIEKYEKY